MFNSEWTASLKYVGSVTAALYGIWATTTDFHEVRFGKKVLTRKGYFGIAMLIAASSLSVFSDIAKDQRDRDSSDEELRDRKTLLNDEKKTGANVSYQVNALSELAGQLAATRVKLDSTSGVLDKTSIDTRSTLKEAERVNDPIGDVGMIHIDLSIPVDHPAVLPYIERLRTLQVIPTPGHNDYPDANNRQEAAVADLAYVHGFQVSIATRERHGFRKHLSFIATCEPKTGESDPRQLSDEGKELKVSCEEDNSELDNDDGTVRSRLDLPGKIMLVEVFAGRNVWVPDATLLSIPLKPELEIWQGRAKKRWVIRDFDRCSGQNVCFYKTLSKRDVEYSPLMPY